MKVWRGCGLGVAAAVWLAAGAGVARAEEGGGRFRLATFNIRCPIDKAPNTWAERVERVRGVIARHGFDLVGLQEATSNQVDDLVGAGWAYVGAGRDDGLRGGEASCVLYRTGRFELRESGTFWLSEQPDRPGVKGWDAACPRVCTWARLADRNSGKEFVWFNTHLDHMGAVAREKGMGLILSRMAGLARGAPVFLTGDMNATPESATIGLARAALRDAAEVSERPHAGPQATFNGFRTEREPTARIDYIFVSPGVRVLSHATLDERPGGLFPSDHFPVMVEAELR